MAGISEGEVAVYDRQLRLWGVQAQQRLLKAKVLIWGLEGCNMEVCKNLVLAGVALVIRDHRTVGEADLAFNYFLRQEDLGKGRAPCAAQRVQEMNPLCCVTANEAPPEDDLTALREALKGCDVVCLGLGVMGYDAAKASAVDAVCREAGAQFLMSVSCGEMAFFFSNLHEHTVQEHSSAQGSSGGSTTEPTAHPEAPAKVAAIDVHRFPSLQEWLKCDPSILLAQKTDASVVLVALLLAFSQHSGRPLQSSDADKFEEFCRSVAKCTPNVDGFEGLKEAYALFFLEPLVHIASIVGGLLAQEVIKAITKRDTPLMNTVCFNAFTSTAIVEEIPAPPKAAAKRKIEEVADILD